MNVRVVSSPPPLPSTPDASLSCPFAMLDQPSTALSRAFSTSSSTDAPRTTFRVEVHPGRPKATSLEEAILHVAHPLWTFLNSTSSFSGVIRSVLVMAALGASAMSLASLGGQYTMRLWGQRTEVCDHTAQLEHDRRYQFTYANTTAANSTSPQNANPYTLAIGPTFAFRIELPRVLAMDQGTTHYTGSDTSHGETLVCMFYDDIPASHVGYYKLMELLQNTYYGHLFYVFPPPLFASTDTVDEEPLAAPGNAADGTTVPLGGSLNLDGDDHHLESPAELYSDGNASTGVDSNLYDSTTPSNSSNSNDEHENGDSIDVQEQTYLVPVYTNLLGQDVLLSTWTTVRAIQEAVFLGETYVNIRFRTVTETQVVVGRNTRGVRWFRLTAFEH
ncbi:hypothetical protein BGZ73_002327 [Actinomortierella ambigua]|nr:hypothetical protein BGZ73_002327 [Actinomortierella ambigua]